MFRFFQDGGCPPSWICLVHIWTTHEEYSVVSIIVQNLVMIDAVVSIIGTFGTFGWKKPIHAQQLGFWGYLTP